MKLRRTSKRGLLITFWVVLMFMAVNQFSNAQVTASISGRIEDTSGAAVPGVVVTVKNLETAASRTVDTDEAGNYRALSLPVGRYEVRAEKAGFNKQVQTGITLTVGQQAVVNLRLEVGAVQQEVTVTAEAAVVNTTTASVSGLVGEQQVKDLPLNGRSFDQLIALNAGAINFSTHQSLAPAGAGQGNAFAVAGRRPGENLFLLNGVQLTGGGYLSQQPGGASGQLLGIDAIREFNVLSGTYSAEYGQRPGGQVILVTQSGTNQLHGTLFEFLRNNKLDARNFFDRTPGVKIPPFKRNQFGGAAGGPIRKDKTFIFGSYEGFRQRLGISVLTFVPDLNARQGLLPNAQGVPTPVPGLDPRMLPFLAAYWPLPNGPNLGGGIAETFSNPAQIIREDYGTVRFDQNFSVKDSLSAAYTIDDGFNQTPFADPLFGSVTALRDQVVSVQETHIFSPQVINTFTAGFSRGALGFSTPPLGPFPSNLSLVTGRLPGAIAIGATTVSAGTFSLTPAGSNRFSNVAVARGLFTYQDGIQVVKGKHQISAGAWFQRLRSNQFGVNPQQGVASFASLQGLLQGNLANLLVTLNPQPVDFRMWEGAWYLQDVIQLRPNLTLSLGLRHEFTNGLSEARGRFPVVLFDASGVTETNTVLRSSAYLENNSKKLFGPRVGLAWDPFGKGKTSIRAAFGTHYWLVEELGFVAGGSPPLNGQVTFTNVPFFSVVPVNSNTPAPPICGPGVPAPCTVFSPQGIQNSLKIPTVNAWNFTVEQQLTPNTSLRVAYVGSRGFHDVLTADNNTVPPQICSNAAGCTSGGIGSARGTVPQGAQYIPVVATRPNPFLSSGTFVFSNGNNFYNALQVEVTRRLSHALQFRGNYTWSRLLDISSAITSGTQTNQSGFLMVPQNPGRDWGPSALNITHQASGNFSYELPIGRGKAWLNGASGVADKLASGWQVNGIVTLLSGFPSSALAGSNRSGSGETHSPDRPSANPAFRGPLVLGNPNRWFDPNAFVLPTAGTHGNVGKGTIIGPDLRTFDFSLFKTTRISERVGLQFRAEGFNILNRANFSSPIGTVFVGTGINPSAGRIASTTTTSRQIQFALKFTF